MSFRTAFIKFYLFFLAHSVKEKERGKEKKKDEGRKILDNKFMYNHLDSNGKNDKSRRT